MKKKSKKNIIRLIETDRLAKQYGSLLKKENPELHAKVKKAITLAKKDINTHFKRDRWNLDYHFYKDDVINQILGNPAARYIEFSLAVGDKYDLECVDNGLKLVYNGKKKAKRNRIALKKKTQKSKINI